MNNEPIHIVVCSDANYLCHTATMLVSLFEHNRQSKVVVHLIGTGIGDIDLLRFRNTLDAYSQQLCFYPFDISNVDSLPKGTHKYITSTTYCRLFIQDILPSYINKVLYLDGDILVMGDIQKMWNTDLTGYLVAATSDEVNGYAEYYARFGFPSDHVYFNAGMLLINLAQWRAEDIKSRAFEFLARTNRPRLDNADQDILNVLCAGKICELPLRYNLQDAILRRSVPNIRKEVEATIDNEIGEGRIFHFSCVKKPWDFRCIHPLKKEYYRFREKTEWRGLVQEVNDKEVIYMIAYWCAYMLGLTNRYRKSVFQFAKRIDID